MNLPPTANVSVGRRLALMLLVATLTPSVLLAADGGQPTDIEVQGHGEVIVPADTLSLRISVETSRPTGDAAARANADAVAKLTDGLRAQLGAGGTVARADYSLIAKRDSVPAPRPLPPEFADSEFVRVEFPQGVFSAEQTATLTDTLLAWDFVQLASSREDRGRGYLTYVVRSDASTASEAVRLNSDRSSKVMQTIRSALADKATITTTSNLIPTRSWAGPAPSDFAPSTAQYTARSEIVAESKSIDLQSDLIRAASSVSDAQVESVALLLRDRNQAQHEAIAKATKDAESKAQAEAAALGVRLGPLLYSEVDLNPPKHPARRVGDNVEFARPVSADNSGVEVGADVTLTYEVEEAKKQK